MRGTRRTLHEQLNDLAQNLWWTWHPEVISLFREIDPDLWRDANHNPFKFLRSLEPDELEARATGRAIEDRVIQARRRLRRYLACEGDTWGELHCGPLRVHPVVYLSAEFCLHESLPIYSGGLGVLAGDHLKSASDLNIPLIGVGLYYSQGYFAQQIDKDGWQSEDYRRIRLDDLPITEARDAEGDTILLEVDTGDGPIRFRVLEVQVGRIRLLLLDADLEDNPEVHRSIAWRLYGGGTETRIRQEILLGVGGMKALKALSITPGVIHLNEGHSAFAPLEAARQRMEEDGVNFKDAWRDVRQKTVFTTHTPVAAGHDRFPPDVIAHQLSPLARDLGLSSRGLMELGREDPDNQQEPFCMTVLAINGSAFTNGVSSLHGRVSRKMWQGLWPDRPEDEIPICHITNGVHIHSWLAPGMAHVYERYLGRDWAKHVTFPDYWRPVRKIPNGELWEAHQVLKHRLGEFVRRRLVQQAERQGQTPTDLAPRSDVLTIGFARRFVPYKRATLIFSDLERAVRLFTDSRRPVQIIFSGKAHPRDERGKKLVQRVCQLAEDDERFRGRVFFIEEYDMNVARHLVQGVDLWLNNPRRPLEACGTSGQKVVLNGGLNLSTLDGWWAEAYDGQNGFAIGGPNTPAEVDEQDRRDAESLYRVLEEEVIPLYYTRDANDVPQGWLDRVKHSLFTLGWRYNSDRMLKDYLNKGYLPAAGATTS